ncbi:FkbM family methyltransferase [Pedobacter cryotolerans]|uniref:FkbM family methyltransferase n=1 Tax=Pedobacter cryotolerans TaxID=2571270 RepID=A0A4U1C066_9SPHI|nr:FkbM family methyltransferase [Pedobacter cryotolerans]TKB98225.1 FkbM family methyltransferase [Pedobacter cryotolerans]
MLSKFKRTFSFIHNHPLAKKYIFKAYKKFLLWQLQTLFFPEKLYVKHFIGNINFYAKKQLTGITGNIYCGLHEFNDMGFLLHFLRSEDTFFDIGANVGAYTLLASGLCNSKTIAFEPIPTTYSILKANIDLNKLGNLVTTENKGISSKKDKLYFTVDEDTTNHILINVKDNQHTILVETDMLDIYYLKNKPSLIKIDVEGFEREVLNGANLTLADLTLKAIIIELNGSGSRYGYDDQEIHDKLLSNGFKPHDYNPLKRELVEITIFGSHNTIYLRDIEFVTDRLNSAAAFKIFNRSI